MTNRFGRQLRLRLTASSAAGPDAADEVIAVFHELPESDPGTASSERPFRLIVERGSDLVLICDRDLLITYAGPSLYGVYGYRGRDVIGTRGWQYVHPKEAFGRDWSRPDAAASTPERIPGFDRLSRREVEVVRMLLRGDRVPVIAQQLFVSQSTVRNHLSSVFRKLRVRSQQELIVLLRERELPG